MNDTLLVALCLAPLGVIFIVMKISLLLFETEKEVEHVIDESTRPHTYLTGVYDDVDEANEED